MKKFVYIFLLALPAAAAPRIYHHDINVKIMPEKHFFKVLDEITFPEASENFVFYLHKNLSPEIFGAKARLISEKESGILIKRAAEFPEKTKKIKISYSGEINQEFRESAENYARSFSETRGVIGEKGVYLSAESGWYPESDDALHTFNIEYSIPKGYSCVSSGRKDKNKWLSDKPLDSITISCAKFTEYSRKDAGRTYYAFLINRNGALAAKYLSATKKWIRTYSELIGNYPYSKFALVENFWETGYGLPSFTLLGPTVIKLPFIINSSYPHEILHNWWGNGVFVDYEKGNWCEGLTVYLADYLIKEQEGKSGEYRMTALKKYADYVLQGKDFPLAQFKSRHSSASEAVGYGKSMMFFHMLRLKLGDGVFKNALKKFYSDYKFKFASFNDIKNVFEKVSGLDLGAFFRQWIERAGAPEISLESAEVKKIGGKYVLDFSLAQKGDDLYDLDIPVSVLFDSHVLQKNVKLGSREKKYSLEFENKPSELLIDPEFDVFRKIKPTETAPTLSKSLGAQKPLMILPFSGSEETAKKYKRFIAPWKKDPQNMPEIKMDAAVMGLPENRDVWILGKSNKFFNMAADGARNYDCVLNKEIFSCGKAETPVKENSVVVSLFNPGNKSYSMTFVNLAESANENTLSRKLPHYGKYSYLAFDPAGNLNLKGVFETDSSPMRRVFSKGKELPLPEREPLAGRYSDFSKETLKKHVSYLSEKLEGRYTFSKNKEKAARHIEKTFKKAGLKTFTQKWRGSINEETGELINVIGKVEGTGKKLKKEAVVLCAHYDHLKSENRNYFPGADDNASGVALMLELARYYAENPQPRTLIFAAFDAEEYGRLGSGHFVETYDDYKINAAINLDTVGRLFGGRVVILNASTWDGWPRLFADARFSAGVEAVLSKENLDSSDQISFSEKGIPSLQLFSGAHSDFHKTTDTPDNLDYEGMIKTGEFAKEVFTWLASSEFLPRISPRESEKPSPWKMKIPGSLGFMPDFAFQGNGVGIKKVTPGSAAQKAGLKGGDVIKALNGVPVKNLAEYSTELAKYKAGDMVKVEYISGGEKKEAKATLQQR